MTVDAALRGCDLDQAVSAIVEEIRRDPGRGEFRLRFFQLLCLKGEWDRALTQLDLLPNLNPADGDLLMAVPALRSLIASETEREAVFAGRQAPVVFGEPPEWIGHQIEAVRLMATGEWDAALRLVTLAREAAPVSSGTLNGEAFGWIMDADPRFGPSLEVVIGGRYYWMPFTRLESLEVVPPENLHDRVWMSVNLVLSNGSLLGGYLPVRYPGTERSDDQLRLARATVWDQKRPGISLGMGHRFWATDQSDTGLMQVRRLVLNPDE